MQILQALLTPQLRLAGYVQAPQRVVLEVADNGAGIPAALLAEIFVPFFTTKPTGSGSGLSSSRQIMQLHRGSLQVRSVQGVGNRFHLFSSVLNPAILVAEQARRVTFTLSLNQPLGW